MREQLLIYIKCIPEDVLTLFYYSCSISIAMLALTTIVFASYNERIIYKIETLLLDINNTNLNNKLKEMNVLLSKNSTYRSTLMAVLFIMMLATLLWGIVLLNKVLNSNNLIQNIFIVFSGLLVILSIIIIPIILMKLNRNKFIKLIKDSYIIEDLIFFLEKYAHKNYHSLFLENIQPIININLFSKQEMTMNIHQNLKIYNLNYIIELSSPEKEACIINFSMSTLESAKFKVKSVSDNVNNYEGLFTELNTYSFFIYIFLKKRVFMFVHFRKKFEGKTISYKTKEICDKSVLDSIKKEISNDNYLNLLSCNKYYYLIKK